MSIGKLEQCCWIAVLARSSSVFQIKFPYRVFVHLKCITFHYDFLRIYIFLVHRFSLSDLETLKIVFVTESKLKSGAISFSSTFGFYFCIKVN